jgi:hypothetical protein
MPRETIPPAILKALHSVTGKRAKVVIEHIIRHGFVTTEDLTKRYGYEHPPRAARDVREAGVPLETIKVKDSSGKTIGAYKFGKWSDWKTDRLGGRKTFSKEFKEALLGDFKSKCAICITEYDSRYLQIDHRVPYEVGGDPESGKRDVADYMLLCSSCNRAKSWSCEHCANWTTGKNPLVCKTCYWASPLSYKHIALREIRRLDVVWTSDEVKAFEQLRRRSQAQGQEMPVYVKRLVNDHLKED